MHRGHFFEEGVLKFCSSIGSLKYPPREKREEREIGERERERERERGRDMTASLNS